MSYADVAASGPRQSAKEAAAPPPPEIVPRETASTASLVDVDLPSVHTVPSDFREQDITTETQAQRRERDSAAAAAAAAAAASKAKAKSHKATKDAAAKVSAADSWLTKHFSELSDGSAGALAFVNLGAVVGLSSYLGYKAWGLYDKGRLDWKSAGTGLGILAAVGVVESVIGGYLYKGKKKGSP